MLIKTDHISGEAVERWAAENGCSIKLLEVDDEGNMQGCSMSTKEEQDKFWDWIIAQADLA